MDGSSEEERMAKDAPETAEQRERKKLLGNSADFDFSWFA